MDSKASIHGEVMENNRIVWVVIWVLQKLKIMEGQGVGGNFNCFGILLHFPFSSLSDTHVDMVK